MELENNNYLETPMVEIYIKLTREITFKWNGMKQLLVVAEITLN